MVRGPLGLGHGAAPRYYILLGVWTIGRRREGAVCDLLRARNLEADWICSRHDGGRILLRLPALSKGAGSQGSSPGPVLSTVQFTTPVHCASSAACASKRSTRLPSSSRRVVRGGVRDHFLSPTTVYGHIKSLETDLQSTLVAMPRAKRALRRSAAQTARHGYDRYQHQRV